jgi:DNA ligase-1
MKPMRSCAPTESYPVQFPCYGSYKIDGIRIVKHEGKALTKSLKPVPNKAIARWVECNLPDGVDGEIISGQPNQEDVYTKTFTAAMTIEGTYEFSIYLFDLHNLPKAYATERYNALKSLVSNLSDPVKAAVKVVDKRVLNTQAEFDAMYAEALDLGYEGLVTQSLDGLYKHGKCTPKEGTQLKHKPEEDRDFQVTGIYEAMHNGNDAFTNEVGDTARSSHAENLTGLGMVGGFYAIDVESGVDFKVAPGKLTHDERVSIWKEYQADPASWIGRFGKYRAMGYGTMTNGRPRHGRFYAWRDATDLSLQD